MTNVWRLVAMALLGVVIGASGGIWFYSKFIEEPQTVIHHQSEIKQKIKGAGNSGAQSKDEDIDIDLDQRQQKKKQKK